MVATGATVPCTFLAPRCPQRARRVHVGVYAFRTQALLHFASLPASPLQVAEDLEQLRLLESHVEIDVIPFAHDCLSVDTPADLDAVRTHLAA